MPGVVASNALEVQLVGRNPAIAWVAMAVLLLGTLFLFVVIFGGALRGAPSREERRALAQQEHERNRALQRELRPYRPRVRWLLLVALVVVALAYSVVVLAQHG